MKLLPPLRVVVQGILGHQEASVTDFAAERGHERLTLGGIQTPVALAVEVVLGLELLATLVGAEDGDQVLDGDLLASADVPSSSHHNPVGESPGVNFMSLS